MPLLNWLLEDHILTKKLRDYSVKYVKISEVDQARSRRLVRDYIEDHIMEHCRQNSSLPILRLEYTGSVYERLKTEASDEVDVMVVLKTRRPLLWGDPEVMVEDAGKAGYARLKAREDSKLLNYASPEGYIIPERLRNAWFHSIVVQAVNAFNNSYSHSDVRLSARYHGPAVQVDIMGKGTYEKLLSVDLVPCFEIGAGEYFVPKSSRSMTVPHADLLWRQSFSLNEKIMLLCMDRDDNGCRHELLRIVKTIIKSQQTSLGALESYHVKSAFVHYIIENPHGWSGRNSLGKHFLGFLRKLQSFLQKGNLPIYWKRDVNLLEDVNPVVLDHMANRLKGILNSEVEMNNILVSRLPQGKSIMEREWNQYTSRFRMPQNTEGGMPNDQSSIFSGFKLGLELVQVFIEKAIACIWFVLKILTAIVIFLFLILVIAIIIAEEEISRQRQDGL